MKLNFLELSENIAEGQRVENFIVQHRNEDKIWFNSFEGTTIGTKKIMKLHGIETDAVRILMVSSRDTPEINKIALYKKMTSDALHTSEVCLSQFLFFQQTCRRFVKEYRHIVMLLKYRCRTTRSNFTLNSRLYRLCLTFACRDEHYLFRSHY